MPDSRIRSIERFLSVGEARSLFDRGYQSRFQIDGRTPELEDEVDLAIWRDVPYDVGAPDDPLRTLDLIRPLAEVEADRPVVVFVHGGGWRGGDKSDDSHVHENLCAEIARREWLVANVNHRLAPQADWRAQARDVAAAIALVAASAERFGGDGTRIVLVGHSSGGHLVALVALDDRWLRDAGVPGGVVRGVVPISAILDIADFAQDRTNLRAMVRPAFGEDTDAWADASPISWAGPEAPPFYLLTGENDEPHAIEEATRLDRLLGEAGVRSAAVSVPGADHFSILASVIVPGSTVVDDIVTFADSVVGGPRAEADWREQGIGDEGA